MLNSFTTKAAQQVVVLAGTIMAILVLGYAAAYADAKLIAGGITAIILMIVIGRNPLVGVYLLIFFLPFERIGSLDLAGVTIRISQVIAILTIVAWVVRGFALNKFKLRPNPLLLPLGIFVMINLIGLLNTPNLSRSLLVLGFTLFTIGIAIAIPNILRQPDQIRTALTVLLVSSLLVTLFGIYQFLGDLVGLSPSLTGLRPQYTKDILGFPRVQSTALEPLYFANYLLIPLAVALALFLSRASRWRPIALLACIVLGSLNLVLTVSRGGYIAYAIMLLLLGIIYLKQLLQPKILITLLVSITLVGFIAFRFFNAGAQLEQFVNHVTDLFGGASYAERVETSDLAYQIWAEHPLVGIGPGGFGPVASYHPLIEPSNGYKIVNNEYLELLAETGALGLACFIIMIVVILVRSVKALRHGTDPFLRATVFALTIAYIGILVQYNTFSILYIMHIWCTVGLLITTQNCLLYAPKPTTQ